MSYIPKSGKDTPNPFYAIMAAIIICLVIYFLTALIK